MHKLGSQVVASWLKSQMKRFSGTAANDTKVPLTVARGPLCVPQKPTAFDVRPLLLDNSQVLQLTQLETSLETTLQEIRSLLGFARLKIDEGISSNYDTLIAGEAVVATLAPICSSPLASDRFSEDATIVQDEPGLEIEAAWNHLRNLAEVVCFCKNLWDGLEQKRQDIYTTCILTNLAIREMQSLHGDFASRHPHLDTAEALHQCLGIDMKMLGEITGQQGFSSDRSLSDLLNPAWFAYLRAWVDFPQRTPIHHQHPVFHRITLALCALGRMTASGIGLRQQDFLIDGVVTLMTSKTIPTWLPSALSIYTYILDRFTNDTTSPWTLQEKLLGQIIFNIENLVTREKGLHSIQHLDRIVGSCEGLLKGNAALQDSLEMFPIGAYSIGYQIKLDAYLGALRYCKERSHLGVVSRIYGICMRSKLLSTPWADLEYVLDRHRYAHCCPLGSAYKVPGQSNIPVGSVEFFQTPAEVFNGCIHDNLHLRPPAILARIFDWSKSDPVSTFWHSCRKEVIKHKRNCQPPILGLEQLSHSLRQQEYELAFNYLTMSYNCEIILQSIQTTYGFQTPDEINSTLLSEMVPNFLSQRPGARVQSHPLSKAASVLERFISQCGCEVSEMTTAAINEVWTRLGKDYREAGSWGPAAEVVKHSQCF